MAYIAIFRVFTGFLTTNSTGIARVPVVALVDWVDGMTNRHRTAHGNGSISCFYCEVVGDYPKIEKPRKTQNTAFHEVHKNSPHVAARESIRKTPDFSGVVLP